MPKKIERFSGPEVHLEARRLFQPGDVLYRHVLNEIDLARQQGGDARRIRLDGEIGDLLAPSGNWPLPQ